MWGHVRPPAYNTINDPITLHADVSGTKVTLNFDWRETCISSNTITNICHKSLPSHFNFERSAGKLAVLVSVVCILVTEVVSLLLLSARLQSVTLESATRDSVRLQAVTRESATRESVACEEYWARSAVTGSSSSSVTALRRPERIDAWKRAMSASRWYGCKSQSSLALQISHQILRLYAKNSTSTTILP